jgi:hypothetical protein
MGTATKAPMAIMTAAMTGASMAAVTAATVVIMMGIAVTTIIIGVTTEKGVATIAE